MYVFYLFNTAETNKVLKAGQPKIDTVEVFHFNHDAHKRATGKFNEAQLHFSSMAE